MMDKQQLNDNLFDQVLKYVAQKRMEELPLEYEPDGQIEREVTLRPEFEKRMKTLFNRKARKERALRMRRIALRSGIAAAIVLAALVTVVFSVDAFRVPVLNFFNELGPESVTIYIDEKANYNALGEKVKGLFLPEYVPDSFSPKAIENPQQSYTVVFENPRKERLRLGHLIKGETLGLDIENVQVENLTVNGEPAQFYSKAGQRNTLIFFYKQNAFYINGAIPKEDMLRMAKSMKYIP